MNKKVAFVGMFSGLYVILSLFSLNLGNIKLNFALIPIILSAYMLGTSYSMLIALIGVFIQQMLQFGLSPTIILWIIPHVLRALFIGCIVKAYPNIKNNIYYSGILIVLSSIITTFLNTGAIYLDSIIYGYYSYEYVFASLLYRLIIGIATAAVSNVLIFYVYKNIKNMRC